VLHPLLHIQQRGLDGTRLRPRRDAGATNPRESLPGLDDFLSSILKLLLVDTAQLQQMLQPQKPDFDLKVIKHTRDSEKP
jgi:hypothetical protein